MTRLAVASLAIATLACGQTTPDGPLARDTVAVYLAAWDQVVGDPPLPNPRDSTVRVCLEERPEQGSLEDYPLWSVDVSRGIVGGLEERGFQAVTGCAVSRELASSPGGWVRDASGLPAVVVFLMRLEFEGTDTSHIRLDHVSGGSWSDGQECSLVRYDNRDWSVDDCRVLY